jgi:hypothetical protein
MGLAMADGGSIDVMQWRSSRAECIRNRSRRVCSIAYVIALPGAVRFLNLCQVRTEVK